MMFHFKRRAGWYILQVSASSYSSLIPLFQAYLPTYLTICICLLWFI